MSRTPDPGFDPRIADWLEADPSLAPPDLMRVVEGALPSIPQRRAWRLSWRLPSVNRFVLVAAAVGLVALAGLGLLAGGSRPTTPLPTPVPTAAPVPSASVRPTPLAVVTDLPGKLLFEHLGNAPDLSEKDAVEYNPQRRRLYIAAPANLSSTGFTEFLPGEPATGKTAADISPDGTRVVFQDWPEQDWTTRTRLYEANLDGTSLRQLQTDCSCAQLYPAYDPTGTKVVYVQVEGDQSWLAIRDLATGKVTTLESTVGPSADAVPEQPDWSPDGTEIVFSRITWGGGEPVVGTVHYGDTSPASGVLQIVHLASGNVRTLDLPGKIPGDASWEPDGAAIVYTDGPMSTTGSVAGMRHPGTFVVSSDGSGDRLLSSRSGGANWTPDGGHVLLVENVPYLLDADGANIAPVNDRAMDMSDRAQGFIYVAHWIPDR